MLYQLSYTRMDSQLMRMSLYITRKIKKSKSEFRKKKIFLEIILNKVVFSSIFSVDYGILNSPEASKEYYTAPLKRHNDLYDT